MTLTPNVGVEWLVLLCRILEVLGSHIGGRLVILTGIFRGFLQSLQGNIKIVLNIRPRKFPSSYPQFTVQ
jgi:hypothetical protein